MKIMAAKISATSNSGVALGVSLENGIMTSISKAKRQRNDIVKMAKRSMAAWRKMA
jgi:hypothetical protein